MRCPSCNRPFTYKGRSQYFIPPTDIYSCRECAASSKTDYEPTVEVREGWYFLHDYHLLFRNEEWVGNDACFAIEAPYYHTHSPETPVIALKAICEINNPQWMCWGHFQKHLQIHTIPYMALPANEDFTEQFRLLKQRIIADWREKLSHRSCQLLDRYNANIDHVRREKWADQYL